MKTKIDEFFCDGHTTVARIGSDVFKQTSFSKEEHIKILHSIAEEAPSIYSKINALICSIKEKVLSCNPLALLSCSQMMFFASSMASNSELNIQDYDRVANIHLTEYIQSIIVSCTPSVSGAIEDPSVVFLEINHLFVELYQYITKYYRSIIAQYQINHIHEDDILRDLLEAQMMFSVRGHRYQFFEYDYHKHLLQPHESIFQKLFGMSIGDVLEGFKRLQHALSQGKINSANDLNSLIDVFPSESEESADVFLKDKHDFVSELISKTFGVSLNDVCKVTGWDRRFVDELSYGIGEYNGMFTSGRYSYWPVVDLPIHKRPFVKIGDSYYCFDYYSFVDNFYRAIQKCIQRVDNSYNWSLVQQQASESMTEITLEKIFPGCTIFKNNYYPQNGSMKNLCENDLLVLYYNVLFIVEVKAGSFVYTAPLFDFENHIKSYKNLIEKPEQQCSRTLKYLKTSDNPVIYDEGGRPKTSINMAKIEQIFMVSLTIDNINTFASRAEKISFLKYNSDAICISIDDLMIYQDYFLSPLVFLHFLKNRAAATLIRNLLPSDELDHLGMYIHNNCYYMNFEEREDFDSIRPIGFREDLDSYYNQKYHSQLHPKKPEQNLPDLYNKIISFLDASSIENKVQIAYFLLDLGTDAREEFVKQVKLVIDSQRVTGRVRIINTAGGDKYCCRYSGFISQPEVKMLSLDEQKDYVWSSMLWNEEKERAHLCLTVDARDDVTNISLFVYNQNDIPSNRRADLYKQGEKRARYRFKQYIEKHGPKIGVNDLCPCESGKKYKKCCRVRGTDWYKNKLQEKQPLMITHCLLKKSI